MKNLKNESSVDFERVLKHPKEYAKMFSENDKDLEKLLLNCLECNIQTRGCCAGHSDNGYRKYIGFSFNKESMQELYSMVKSIINTPNEATISNALDGSITISFSNSDKRDPMLFQYLNSSLNIIDTPGENFLKLIKIADIFGKSKYSIPKTKYNQNKWFLQITLPSNQETAKFFTNCNTIMKIFNELNGKVIEEQKLGEHHFVVYDMDNVDLDLIIEYMSDKIIPIQNHLYLKR